MIDPARIARTFGPALAAAMALSVALVVGAGPAAAKSSRVVRYSFEEVWSTALRLLRIDLGHEIVEKDAEAGYVIFAVNEDGKRFRGTFEVIRFQDGDGRDRLRLLVGIEDRPGYMEDLVLDKLERKLRKERGPPRERAPAPAPDPPKDDGGGDGDDTGTKASPGRP
ncbi:hypothetical protein [Haliangium sp.]|uniref:hypothetical protein n=1 Tax=Haliangium sp. TaxID=2663208 RepID=UPI003D0FD5EF